MAYINTTFEPNGKYFWFKIIFVNLAVAGVYFLFGKLGLLFSFVKENVTLIWPPSGIALFLLFVFGYKIIPGLVLGAFITTFSTGAPILFAGATALGNPLEAIVAVYFLKKFKFSPQFNEIRSLVLFFLIAVLIAPLFSSSIGVLGLCLSNLLPWEKFFVVFYKWSIGDGMGILIFAPLLFILFFQYPYERFSEKKKVIEIILLFIILIISCIYIFKNIMHFKHPQLSFIYLVFPFIFYTGFRFEQIGTSVAVKTISIIAVLKIVHNFGTVPIKELNTALIQAWAYLSIINVSGLLFGISVHERNELVNNLKSMGKELHLRNEALSKYTYIIAHDLKSPINNLTGLLSLFNKKSLDEESKFIFDKIEGSIYRIDRTVKEVSETFRENKKGDIQKLNIREVLQQVKLSLEADIWSYRGRLIEDFDRAPYVYATFTILQSILQNLLSNSLKYKHSSRDPIIKFKTSILNEGLVCLTVIDNGRGIDLSKDKDRLFSKFERLTGEVEGKGLGLYLVKSQIESIGGHIEVMSKPDVGTVFKIFFKG